MNKPLISLMFSLVSTCLFSQIKYQNLSFVEAGAKAKKENKIIMMVVESAKCRQCNDVANVGLQFAKLSIDSNCILINQPTIAPEITKSNMIYAVPKDFFGIIWFDQQLNILNVMSSSHSYYYPYVQGIQKAKAELTNSSVSFNNLKLDYYNKIGNFQVIKKLIEKTMQIGLEPSTDIIDELAMKVPKDSAESIEFLQYILRCAPGIGSSAQKYAEKNRDIYMMAWWKLSMKERIQINNRIVDKSLNKAVAEKNVSYAYQIASFRQNTFTDNPEDGQRANLKLMLDYYNSVNDSTTYMRTVFNYLDRFYMQIKPEDIRIDDSLMLQKSINQANPANSKAELLQKLPDSLRKRILKNNLTVSIKYAPKSQFYASELNEGAWNIYSYTKNSVYLNKALIYSKRALAFFEGPEISDTYARLLYSTGNKEEAIIWEQKAIDGRKQRNMPSDDFAKVLQQMKKGNAEIDN